jgi:hypothetical protein
MTTRPSSVCGSLESNAMRSFKTRMQLGKHDVRVQYPLLKAVGVGRGGDMSLTGSHPLWEKIFTQKLQAVADQGCHLEGSSSYKGTAYRGVYCI